jgi:alpha-L-rhamnosidase
MKPIDCKIQNYYTQTGVLGDIIFMWKYGAGEHMQTAYKIDIFYNDRLIYSTNKVISDAQNNIELSLDLEEQTKYSFTVSVWDENDFCEQSDKTYFTTGAQKWRGRWIGTGMGKPFVARKTFTVGTVKCAVLSVCVPGQFEAKINGQNISPYAYEGSQTDFNKHIHYSTYDVTKFIKNGENEITIEAANGWYIGDDDNGRRYFYTMDKGYEPFGECLVVTAQLKIDGNYIVTDNSWEVSKSKTMLADIYGSEDIDNTIEYEWSKAKIVTAPKGELIPLDYPPVIHKYCYIPKSVNKDRICVSRRD